jgi:hypothetical protein
MRHLTKHGSDDQEQNLAKPRRKLEFLSSA